MFEGRTDFKGKTRRDLGAIAEKYGAEAVLDAWDVFLERVMGDGLPTKAPDLGQLGSGGFINLIPSSVYGPCTPELLVLCFDKDNLHERLREMLYHAGIMCSHRLVFFCTTKWDPYVFDLHERAVEALRQRGTTIVFVLIGPKGAQEMPI